MSTEPISPHPLSPTCTGVGGEEVALPELPFSDHFKALGPGELFTAEQMREYARAAIAATGAAK